jgi:hypothetical protein
MPNEPGDPFVRTDAQRIAAALMDDHADWMINGGDAASIHVLNDLLIISAPPDMQRSAATEIAALPTKK